MSLNDQVLDVVLPLREGWQVIEVTLPESLLHQGLNILTLQFDHATPPSAVLPGALDDRPLAAAVDWLEVSQR
jgi:hypothetical protein